MLKKYIDRDSSVISSVNLVNTVPLEQNQMDSEDMNFVQSDPASSKLKNSDILKDLDQKLSHLSSDKRLELKQLILEYEHLFPDIPSKTDKRGSSKSAHAWIWIIFCMFNTYGITTTKMKLFYSSNAVRPQGDTLKYTLFVLIYDLLNISLKSLTLLTATFFECNIKEDFPG